jgi:hypothetical protein
MRVEHGLIDVHDGQGRGMIIVLLLLSYLLSSEVAAQWTRRGRSERLEWRFLAERSHVYGGIMEYLTCSSRTRLDLWHWLKQ